jgi:hypothetical protein
VDNHVDPPGQITQQHSSLSIGQVEGDALLAGIEIEEGSAALGMGDIPWKRAAATGRVSFRWGLGLDHLGPQGGQQLAAIWPAYPFGDFQHTQPGQGLG